MPFGASGAKRPAGRRRIAATGAKTGGKPFLAPPPLIVSPAFGGGHRYTPMPVGGPAIASIIGFIAVCALNSANTAIAMP